MIIRGVRNTRLLALTGRTATRGRGLAALGMQALDGADRTHDPVPGMVHRLKSEPGDRLGIRGEGLGHLGFHLAAIGSLPGGTRIVSRHLLPRMVIQLRVGTRQYPAKSAAGGLANVNLVTQGMSFQNQPFVRRRF